ncbi:MAG: hypothetical protein HFH86_03650 [Bacilli bacterium]|jgi:hypothetical protein|nr:hypothetical protein [Bacilli bacterium]
MEMIIDFLANNYMWFLLITIVLIFALVGYIVDSREKKDLSIFESPQEMARNLEMLAMSAQNKKISEAVLPKQNSMINQNAPVNNTIYENQNPAFMNQMNSLSNPMENPANQNTSFEVLGK